MLLVALRLLLDSALNLIDQAVEADKYEIASPLDSLAVSLTKKTPLRKHVLERSKQFRAVHKAYQAVRPAIETLKQSPDDADANLEVGRFYCLAKGNWEKGLPLLAKGSDASLKSLAARDIAGASASTEQLALAETWSNFSTSQIGASKVQLELRAVRWYLDALPEISGLAKANVEKRLNQFRKQMVGEANTYADEHAGFAGIKNRGNVYHLNVESVGRQRLLKFWFPSGMGDSYGEVALIDPDGKRSIVRLLTPKDFTRIRGKSAKSYDDLNSAVVDVTAIVKKPGLYKVSFHYKRGKNTLGIRRVQINTGQHPQQARLAATAFSRKGIILKFGTQTSSKSKTDYARINDMTFEVGMGSRSDGTGISTAGVEMQGIQSIKVVLSTSGKFQRITPDYSYVGFIIDYHTSPGYSKRVALSLGGIGSTRKGNMPAWGKGAPPNEIINMPTRTTYELNLKQWAPKDWDGKVWFTAILHSSGRGTSLKAQIISLKP